MKTTKILFAGVAAFALMSGAAMADKISGTISCGKCNLGTASKCQDVIVASAGGKKVQYIVDKAKSKKSGWKHVCKGSKQVEVEGKVTKKGGKNFIALTSYKAK